MIVKMSNFLSIWNFQYTSYENQDFGYDTSFIYIKFIYQFSMHETINCYENMHFIESQSRLKIENIGPRLMEHLAVSLLYASKNK